MTTVSLEALLADVHACTRCAAHLPHGVRAVQMLRGLKVALGAEKVLEGF